MWIKDIMFINITIIRIITIKSIITITIVDTTIWIIMEMEMEMHMSITITITKANKDNIWLRTQHKLMVTSIKLKQLNRLKLMLLLPKLKNNKKRSQNHQHQLNYRRKNLQFKKSGSLLMPPIRNSWKLQSISNYLNKFKNLKNGRKLCRLCLPCNKIKETKKALKKIFKRAEILIKTTIRKEIKIKADSL